MKGRASKSSEKGKKKGARSYQNLIKKGVVKRIRFQTAFLIAFGVIWGRVKSQKGFNKLIKKTLKKCRFFGRRFLPSKWKTGLYPSAKPSKKDQGRGRGRGTPSQRGYWFKRTLNHLTPRGLVGLMLSSTGPWVP